MTSKSSLPRADLHRLRDLAAETARDVGQWIASVRPTTVESKGSGLSPAAQVVTEIDREAEQRILDALAPATQHYAFGCLTEERPDDGSRHQRDHFWCIDPLDGTLPYIEGRAGFSVSIALVRRQGEAVVGAVYVPTTSTLYAAAHEGGATKDGEPLHVSAMADVFSVFGDRSFRQGAADAVADALGGLPVRESFGGGGVVNALSVIDNAPACYFKKPKVADGGGSLWDFAATSCIVQEAGGVATAFDGHPLKLNDAETTFMNRSGVLFASSADVASAVRRCTPSKSTA